MRRSGILKSRQGFTFIEILATLTLVAIVLPVVMRGISLATAAASESKKRSEAVILANNLLTEFVSSGDTDFSVLSGDFAPGGTEYRWTAEISAMDGENVKELTVRVLWTARNREQSVPLSALIYTGGQR